MFLVTRKKKHDKPKTKLSIAYLSTISHQDFCLNRVYLAQEKGNGYELKFSWAGINTSYVVQALRAERIVTNMACIGNYF